MSASGGGVCSGGWWGCLPLGVSALGGCLLWGVSAPRGFLSGGCLLWGVSGPGEGGVFALGGVWPGEGGVCSRGCLLQGGIPACTETPPCGQTDACKT